PTIKQWIYEEKIRSVPTAGGHHRIPQSEVDRLLFRTTAMRRVSGRNQLVGRIASVRIGGLMAEVVLSIGEQRITSIITASSARDMNLKAGQTAAAPDQSHRRHDPPGVRRRAFTLVGKGTASAA